MKRKVLVLLLTAFVLLTCFAGCDKYKTLETDEVRGYIEDMYDGEFKILSITEQDEDNRYYLDPDMNAEKPNNEGDDRRDDIIYKMKDENGIEFHVTAMFNYGMFGSHFTYYDDYCIQLLKSNDEFIEKIEAIEFPVEYFNGIGTDDHNSYYAITIKSYDEIPEAITAMHEILSEFTVPYPSKTYEDKDVSPIRPKFKIVCDNEYTNYALLTVGFPATENPEIDELSEFIRVTEWNYTNIARKNGEPLPDEVLEKYPPERIRDITYNGEDIAGDLYYGRKSQNMDDKWRFDSFVFWDNGDKISEADDANVRYENLEKFLTEVGYKVEYKDHSAIYTGHGRVVKITEKVAGHECTVNGEIYKPEGLLGYLMRITEKDMENMFGITFKIDRVNATAEVFVN